MQNIIFQSSRSLLDIFESDYIYSQADSCPPTTIEKKAFPVGGGVTYYFAHHNYDISNNMQTVMLMCPICFELFAVKMQYNVNIEAISMTKGLTLEFGHHIKIFSENGCPNCNSEEAFIKLDPNIATTVCILNRKGYFTSYCCEYHFGKDCGSSAPYIAFKNTDIFDYIDYLPDSWYPDFESYKLWGNPVIRATTPRDTDELKDSILDLLQFAYQLPDSKTLKNAIPSTE